MADETNNAEPKLPENDDEQNTSSIATAADLESLPKLAEKPGAAVELQSEWNLKSSLQILGAFMLLFNSYVSYFVRSLLTFADGDT